MAKRRNKAGKGSKYERELCVLFSNWWTDERRDDVFWRTSTSGGRAKRRGRAGLLTHGQAGDICATHPSGEALMQFVTIEIKRGYKQHSVADTFDRPMEAAQQKWESWLQQTVESWEQSGAYAWLLITKRDQREPLVFMPRRLFVTLREEGCFEGGLRFGLQFSAFFRKRHDNRVESSYHVIHGMLLKEWMECVTPKLIKRLVKEM